MTVNKSKMMKVKADCK